MEARRNSRSKGIIFIIFLLPLLIWGFQIGLLQLEIEEEPELIGETIYVVNQDITIGNSSLGMVFVQSLNQSTYINTSIIYQANLELLEVDNGINVKDFVLDNDYSPLYYIPANFTQLYFDFVDENSPNPTLALYLLPTDNNLRYGLETMTSSIISSAPFSVYQVDRFVGTRWNVVLEEGEALPDPISAWQAAFFTLYAALIAPMPLVTSSFAREREKNTLESLLAMPMQPLDILMGKFFGGAILLSIFSIMNIMGLFIYDVVVGVTGIRDKINVMEVNITPLNIVFLFASIYLTAVVALALGISITSRIKDVRTTETSYNMVMLIPFAIIAIALLIADPGPYHPLFILPWPHAIAIIFKGLYPNSFLTETITGNYTFDVVIHIIVLIIYALVSIGIAAFLSERGKIFILGD
jgi:ABC-type Na+ efflux pump permease subunit